ncbi:MAG: single-stranded-DNA-specific exonuclease RecJ [Ruminococcaceae bacterium]|nr:single-stranded-DNA-specific exonuclease RecJ [Oscillospiraceae bacterium]
MQSKTVKEKKWILKDCDDAISKQNVAKIAKILNIHPIIAKLLYCRGYNDVDSVKSFISMESEMLCDPFKMMDMDKGIERIRLAIENKEKITVYGDYDVDGVTSVCTLYLYLQSKGAIIDYYIPNRAGEGYGVSVSAIEQIKENGTKLVITVDTGITANEEVDHAKSIGVDFVITDHHECHADTPAACAVVNPHRHDCGYPFKELAGVGVVFKLISAYEEKVCGKSRKDAALKIFSEYADLVAIGTIADVMPIKSENRIIVSYGLRMIENTKRPGIVALMEASSVKDSQKNERVKKRSKITSGYVGYTLAPRINAAGRIRSATLAVELFLSKDLESAHVIAEELCNANKERQNEENKIIKEAFEKIEKMDLDNNPIIVLDADSWHHGVIGIVSSRITEKYSRPSILVSFEGNDGDTVSGDDVGKGSGRSIKGLNLVDALCYCEPHLLKFGGHELAAGLSVLRSELNAFREKINEYARINLSNVDMIPTIEGDCTIDFSDLNLYFAQQLQQLEPYGVGNPIPTFVMRGVWVNEIIPVSDGKHSRIVLSDGVSSVTAMCFSNSPESLCVYSGDKVDVLFNLDINEWLGRKSVQLIVKDIKRTVGVADVAQEERERFLEIWNGAPIMPDENVLPSREDFVAVYRFILASSRIGVDSFSHRELVIRLAKGPDAVDMNYVKLKIIIKVFQELNVLGIDEFKEENYRFTVRYAQKTNLEKSGLLRRFRNQQKKD